MSEGSIEASSPYQGHVPGLHVYQDERTLKRCTASAVQSLMDRGIAIADIVVLSGRGHARSILLRASHIGEHGTRRFSGRYPADGEPCWTEGELLVESIYRFKGQSAAGVVLSELDFDAVEENVRGRLFVGLTRAHLAAELVLSSAAERSLAGML